MRTKFAGLGVLMLLCLVVRASSGQNSVQLDSNRALTLTTPANVATLAVSFGGMVAAGLDDGEVLVWDRLSDEPNKAPTSLKHAHKIAALQFSPDASLLAVVTEDGQVTLWKADGWQQVRTLDVKGAKPTVPDFDITNTRIAVGYAGGDIHVWDATTGTSVANFSTPKRILAVSFKPKDSNTLLAITDEKEKNLLTIDLAAKQISDKTSLLNDAEKKEGETHFRSVAVSTESKQFAILKHRVHFLVRDIQEDPSIELLDPAKSTVLRVIDKDRSNVPLTNDAAFAISPDGTLVASVPQVQGHESQFRVWSIKSKDILGTIKVPTRIRSMQFGYIKSGLQLTVADGKEIRLYPVMAKGEDVPEQTVALLDDKGSVEAQDIRAFVAGAAEATIRNSNAYRVVTRNDLKEILQEQQLSADGLVEKTTRVKLGKLVGAQKFFKIKAAKAGNQYFVTLELESVETSEILGNAVGFCAADDLAKLYDLVVGKSQELLKGKQAKRGEEGAHASHSSLSRVLLPDSFSLLSQFIPLAFCGKPVAFRAEKIRHAKSEHWALIVGINEYGSAINPLKCSVQDARSMYQTLMDPAVCGCSPDHVTLLTSDDAQKPTRQHILETLKGLIAHVQKGDSFWFYFSGHGVDYPVNGEVQSYLLTSGVKLDAVPTTAISVHEIREILKPCDAGCKLVILDACHSGSSKGVAVEAVDPIAPAAPPNMATLAACRTNQVAYEFPGELPNSVFTYYLMLGLRGAADANHDNKVSVTELGNYLGQVVDQQVVKLTPGQHQNPVVSLSTTVSEFPLSNAKPQPVPSLPVGPLAPIKPPPAVLLISFEENRVTPGGQTLHSLFAESGVRKHLLEKGFMMIDPDAGRRFREAIVAAGGKVTPQQALKAGTAYSLIGTAETSCHTVAGTTLVTATGTITAKIIDENGNVLLDDSVLSDPTPGGNELAAAKEALDDAVNQLIAKILPFLNAPKPVP